MKEWETDYSSGASTDKWAYRDCKSDNSVPTTNNFPSVEYSSADYTKLSAEDDVWVTQNCISSPGAYPFHRFKIKVPGEIKQQSVRQIVIHVNLKWSQGCV